SVFAAARPPNPPPRMMVVVAAIGQGTNPSTTTTFDFAHRWRICRSGRYSGDSSHALARAALSNARITTRLGIHSPSATSVAPPRARAAARAHGAPPAVRGGGGRHPSSVPLVPRRMDPFAVRNHLTRHADPPRLGS